MRTGWAITASNMSLGWGEFLLWQSGSEKDPPITTLAITINNEIDVEEETGFWELLHSSGGSDLSYKHREDLGLMNWEFIW